jgi:hypothetical protein
MVYFNDLINQYLMNIPLYPHYTTMICMGKFWNWWKGCLEMIIIDIMEELLLKQW